MAYCNYYQAHVDRSRAWMMAGILRSYEHLAFDRTLDKAESVFEFYVPADLEKHFLELMETLKERGLIKELRQLPNRLAVLGSTV